MKSYRTDLDFDERRRYPGQVDLPPLFGMAAQDRPARLWRAAAKRAFDIGGSLLLLSLFALPMLALVVLVKVTSRGPILVRQDRTGLGGKTFTMLKFRSMQAGAEMETGPVRAQRDDPRRTRLGIFMRRFSLDELPQLINVLRGEMSLVGPRPERPYFVPQLTRTFPHYMLRYQVKPGITGWAQVNGFRGNTSLEERLNHDLHYVRRCSLGFDLLILLRTPFVILTDNNAY